MNECHCHIDITQFIYSFHVLHEDSFEHPREINNQYFVYAFTELLLRDRKKSVLNKVEIMAVTTIPGNSSSI